MEAITLFFNQNTIIAYDYSENSDFILINEKFQIFRNNRQIECNQYFYSESLFIKLLTEDTFLIVDQEIEDTDNCWIYNNEGVLLNSFYVGSIKAIVTTKKHIIVSYGVASLDSNSKFGNSQIVLFDFLGNIIFQYISERYRTKISFLEVLCFLKKDEQTIFFIAFGLNSTKDLPIIQFDLEDFSTTVLFYLSDYDLNEIIYPRSFTRINKDWYFFDNSYLDENHNSKFKISIFMLNEFLEIEKVYFENSIAIQSIGLIDFGFTFLKIDYDTSNQIENTNSITKFLL